MGKILLVVAIFMWIFSVIPVNLLFLIIGVFILFRVLKKGFYKNQNKFLESYQFPEGLDNKILSTYPHLSKDDLTLIKRELKHYFEIKNTYKFKVFSMPSKVVDVAWHEFILHTKDYHKFCGRAFGHYFHHNPFSGEFSSQNMRCSLLRTWDYSCKAENINPRNPRCLPVIFSIDSTLNIPDGNEFSVENASKSETENNPRHTNNVLKCMNGAFVGLGAMVLVASVEGSVGVEMMVSSSGGSNGDDGDCSGHGGENAGSSDGGGSEGGGCGGCG